MSLHSYVRVYVHVIWRIKKRAMVLTDTIRPAVKEHLLQYANNNDIKVETLNVQSDHVHALIDLSSTQRLEDVLHLLKGESSHWINSDNLVSGKFSWQRGYGAFSVSLTDRRRVRAYIDGQDYCGETRNEHHNSLSTTIHCGETSETSPTIHCGETSHNSLSTTIYCGGIRNSLWWWNKKPQPHNSLSTTTYCGEKNKPTRQPFQRFWNRCPAFIHLPLTSGVL